MKLLWRCLLDILLPSRRRAKYVRKLKKIVDFHPRKKREFIVRLKMRVRVLEVA